MSGCAVEIDGPGGGAPGSDDGVGADEGDASGQGVVGVADGFEVGGTVDGDNGSLTGCPGEAGGGGKGDWGGDGG